MRVSECAAACGRTARVAPQIASRSPSSATLESRAPDHRRCQPSCFGEGVVDLGRDTGSIHIPILGISRFASGKRRRPRCTPRTDVGSSREQGEGQGMDQPVSAATEIAQGNLQGVARDGVLRFNGIPYAGPPVGTLRWQMPQPPEAWAGIARRRGLRQHRAAGLRQTERRARRHAGHAVGRLSLSQRADAGLRRRQARR